MKTYNIESYTLPRGRVVIMQNALMLLAEQAKKNGDTFLQEDATLLLKLLEHTVSISVTQEERIGFCEKHGIDNFPTFR